MACASAVANSYGATSCVLLASSVLHTPSGAALPLLLALTTCYLLNHLTAYYCLLLTAYDFTPGGAALPFLPAR